MELIELREKLYPVFKVIEDNDLTVDLDYSEEEELRFTLYLYPDGKEDSREDYHVMSMTGIDEAFFIDITEFLIEGLIWKRLTYDKLIDDNFIEA